MGRTKAALLFLALLAIPINVANARRNTMAAQVNPIRKVVTMLQAMQTKVSEEGEVEKQLYDKFMCYCSGGKKTLEASIEAAEAKVPAVGSDIEETSGKLAQLKTGKSDAQTSRQAAKEAMASAEAVREKEGAAFSSEKSDSDANIAAIEKAVAALEQGMTGSFLQTGAAQVLRQLAVSQDMMDADRQELTAFLSGSSSYAPQSGQIVGILKQMADTMKKGLADSAATEEDSVKSFEGLMAAKAKEVEALTASIEAKSAQIGESGVQLVQMKEDLDDTEAALLEDKTFLAGLDKSCTTKTAEWEERSKTRADELVALADTIKVLNDDDALELFKKTLPSPASSFVQLGAGASTRRQRALKLISAALSASGKNRRPGLDFLVLALSGKKAVTQGTFDKVIKMCDEMVEVLQKEQQDDDSKKEYCAAQFDLSDDKKKVLVRKISDEEHAIESSKEGIATLIEEIEALKKGISELDKSVAEATEQRKGEHGAFEELMASDTAAKEVLGFAKNRLNKFYNPKLYKPAPKRELSAEDRIVVNMGGEATPTEAPGGIAGTGIKVLAQIRAHNQRDAPAPPPDTWNAYQKKSGENTGVMAMIDLLIKDLDKEMTEAKTSEKDGQADYEVMMKDSADKRTADSKSLTEKEGAKADLEVSLSSHSDTKTDLTGDLMALEKYIHSLHSECDWLMQYYDVRKEARVGEVDSLNKAKAVLSGADYSLLQTKSQAFLSSRLH